MSYAILENSTVVNIAEADPAFAASQGWVLIPAEFTIGDRYANGAFSKPEPAAFTLAERREVLLPRLSQKRYEVETGGILAMGVPVRTDEIGQAKLTGALALFDNDPSLTSIDWEAQPGIWVTLDGPTVAGLGVMVGRHVQACFSRARVISEAIVAASTHAALDQAEAGIITGWPQ